MRYVVFGGPYFLLNFHVLLLMERKLLVCTNLLHLLSTHLFWEHSFDSMDEICKWSRVIYDFGHLYFNSLFNIYHNHGLLYVESGNPFQNSKQLLPENTSLSSNRVWKAHQRWIIVVIVSKKFINYSIPLKFGTLTVCGIGRGCHLAVSCHMWRSGRDVTEITMVLFQTKISDVSTTPSEHLSEYFKYAALIDCLKIKLTDMIPCLSF